MWIQRHGIESCYLGLMNTRILLIAFAVSIVIQQISAFPWFGFGPFFYGFGFPFFFKRGASDDCVSVVDGCRDFIRNTACSSPSEQYTITLGVTDTTHVLVLFQPTTTTSDCMNFSFDTRSVGCNGSSPVLVTIAGRHKGAADDMITNTYPVANRSFVDIQDSLLTKISTGTAYEPITNNCAYPISSLFNDLQIPFDDAMRIFLHESLVNSSGFRSFIQSVRSSPQLLILFAGVCQDEIPTRSDADLMRSLISYSMRSCASGK